MVCMCLNSSECVEFCIKAWDTHHQINHYISTNLLSDILYSLFVFGVRKHVQKGAFGSEYIVTLQGV